jgi:hypothetical protein
MPFIPGWRKSSYSGADSACVEIVGKSHEFVAVRDSKDAVGVSLTFPAGSWRRFTIRVKDNDFDLI